MPRLRLSTDPSLPPSGGPGGPGDGLAVAQIGGVLRRSWAWIAVPTLVAAIGAGVFVQVVTPRYTGEAKVLLESRDPAFARTAAERTDQTQPIDEQAVASQVQVAMSRDIAREAIRSLKLVGNPEFDPEAEGSSAIRRTLMMLGLVSAPMDRPSEDRILESYLDHLLVYPVGKSRILAVEFRSRDPELAARGANTMADLYLASLEAASVDTARYASTWLGNNIANLRARVAEAEAKVEAFRAKHGLIGTGSSAAAQPLSSQQLSELSSQLSQARTIQADLTARAKLLKDMIKEGRAFEIPDVANNELIRRTVESRMAMRAQLALESRTLLPAHPRIKELTAQVQDLENQIKAAAERVVRTLENDAKIAGARVESLRAAVEGQQDVVAKGNTSEVELRALEREAKSQREQLESYLARYREAAARDAENASPANARVVSRAIVPDLPSFPKKLPIVAFATMLAFLLASAGVIGRHLLVTPAGPGGDRTGDEGEPLVQSTRTDRPRDFYPEPEPPPSRRPVYEPVYGGAYPASAAERFAPALAFAHSLRATATVHHPVFASTAPIGAEAAAQADAAKTDKEGLGVPAKSSASSADLDGLIARLENGTGKGQGEGQGKGPLAGPSKGGCVLVVETPRADGTPGLASNLARVLGPRYQTLLVDVNGVVSGPSEPGLTDLVAGAADFLDVIQPVRGSRLHAVKRGAAPLDVLVEEPQGLAIGLNALSQSYDWVLCRLDARHAEDGAELIPAVGPCMDSIVIASDAPSDDPDLVSLYRLAKETGVARVVVARHGEDADLTPSLEGTSLRLSA
ncbi:GumC family protein [Methylorubrum extorquens]|uniref:Lipopolysaccharide biosynthesis protein n=1 Tax=Methylorubrum extorquens DSM 13060 TaxID=882800 RepID=H1KLL5_METEX|nr:exopolysaccharide transport family protein [Methylorubrum extorquens]EHP91573.1 lipopolysaccharide biosynthesis protein [Methylorubrum extorquens DSM 13060]